MGALVIGASTLLFDADLLGGTMWMIGIGLGVYLAYVPFNCILFDRMIAATGMLGTSVFFIYVTDAAGYGGSVALILYKHFGRASMTKVDFVRAFAYVTAGIGMFGFAYSAGYFARRSRVWPVGAAAAK